ncbi:MAG: ATP-binding cassette domain-containing protein [Acidobacteria bacterium]|nr:ATP-binding cassette domain-containing protein [Acidobacteriota bacterium]
MPASSSTVAAPQPPGGHPQEPAIVFQDVTIAFEEKVVLGGVSFELDRGESKAVFGVAGSGKTTILKLALGLLKPDRGTIRVLGRDVTALHEDELFELRRRMGMVFQESALFDSLTVEENVAYRLHEESSHPEEEVHARVVEALRFVELEHTLALFPSQLSGGMRRRVAIARAIVTRPEVLLYDSPTAGLDPITSTTIIELIVKQRDVQESSALMVTHRLQDAFTLAAHYYDLQAGEMRPLQGSGRTVNTSFLILRDGKAIFDGTAQQLAACRDEYIREYIS